MHKQNTPLGNYPKFAAGERINVFPEPSTLQTLFSRHGPLIPADDATHLLGFNTRGALLRAISQQRLPFQLVRPLGRRKSFLATDAVAKYLDNLATGKMEEGTM